MEYVFMHITYGFAFQYAFAKLNLEHEHSKHKHVHLELNPDMHLEHSNLGSCCLYRVVYFVDLNMFYD